MCSLGVCAQTTYYCRMMGFGDEAGIIPRFCDDLFCQLASAEKEKVNICLKIVSVMYLFCFKLCMISLLKDSFI